MALLATVERMDYRNLQVVFCVVLQEGGSFYFKGSIIPLFLFFFKLQWERYGVCKKSK